MTIREAIGKGAEIISERWKDTPLLDSSVILASVLEISKEKLLSSFSETISDTAYSRFMEGVEARTAGAPVAYITQKKEFFGLDFYVDTNVLVPRADTELLVETLLDIIKLQYKATGTVLDLCTGSGCIAISAKYNCPSVDVYASDISEKALDVFKKNCASILGRQLETFKSNLLTDINCKFDIIVSNPPYLTKADTDLMKKDNWPEPRLALDGGIDGLDLIRNIIHSADKNLYNGGWLLFEADPSQMLQIKEEFEKSHFSDILIYKDLAGRDRVITGRRNYGKN